MKKFIIPVATEFDLSLPYYFAGVGIRYEQERIHRPAGHPHYQWIQCREGMGELTLGGKTYFLGEGQGMLLFPHEPHSYHAVTPSWKVDWIILQGKNVEAFIKESLGLRASEVWHITTPHVLAGRLEELYRAAHSAAHTKNLICSSLVYGILLDLLRLHSSPQEPSLLNRYNRLSEALRYIEESYHTPITLGELASRSGLSPQYFCLVFKKATSQTPLEYVNMVRIRKSKEALLFSPDTPIREIALGVGFYDASYFGSVFRRLEGMSPSEFRDLHRAAKA